MTSIFSLINNKYFNENLKSILKENKICPFTPQMEAPLIYDHFKTLIYHMHVLI